MDETHYAALHRVTRSLRASIIAVLNHVDELSAITEGRAGAPPGIPARARSALPPLRVDRAMLAVVWRGRTCHLGNTLPFRLMERFARRPGQYISATQLLEDMWDGPRAASTVRSAVSELRRKLAAAGMADLARMIDGSNRGHYGLLVPARRARSDGNPTATRQRSDSAAP